MPTCNDLVEHGSTKFLAQGFGNLDRVTLGALLVIPMQSVMLACWRRVLVIPRGVDAMSSRAESARIAVEPTSARADNDVTPHQSCFGHGGIATCAGCAVKSPVCHSGIGSGAPLRCAPGLCRKSATRANHDAVRSPTSRVRSEAETRIF